MTIDLIKLAKFLVEAKRATYAKEGSIVLPNPERPQHEELEYQGEEFYYRDSYTGFREANGCGTEEVRSQNKEGLTIWTMLYYGGIWQEYIHGKFAEGVYKFLKDSLSRVSDSMPFRGPSIHTGRIDIGHPIDLIYDNSVEGDITRFHGNERIFLKIFDSNIPQEVYRLEYLGGLVG